jgi:hypothetical protein
VNTARNLGLVLVSCTSTHVLTSEIGLMEEIPSISVRRVAYIEPYTSHDLMLFAELACV